jgi:tRNA 2-selenouridine synthase
VPGATNLPLLSDRERHEVGLTYKRAGQAAAIDVGERLVAGATRESRIDAWEAFAAAHPTAWLYCWRGGLRSRIARDWLASRGVDLPRVPGGFKALRQRCLTIIDRAPGSKPWYVLGGRTGTGKTSLLRGRSSAIDLEGLANHRGSAFGAALTPQPPPVSFENALAVAVLEHRAPALILEDESRTIGRLALPQQWHEAMQRAPLIILEAARDVRVAHIVDEYVWAPLAAGLAAVTLKARLDEALARIRKRLGGARLREVQALLEAGFQHGEHVPWVERLLSWYYDPMYDYQLARKQDRVVFSGERAAVEAFLESLP